MDFIREKIKDKPLNKKQVLMKILLSALCGLVFSLVCCVVFVILYPWIIKGNQEVALVSSETEITTTEDETESEELGTETETETEVEIPQELSLSIEDYQEIQDELYKIGMEASKSIVTVSSSSSELDWLNSPYETTKQGSGVIISENSEQFFVLVDANYVKDASNLKVSFMNDSFVEAKFLKEDKNLGLAILTVQKSDISDNTKEVVKVATLGNSYSTSLGMMAIAIGNPLGTSYSIVTGNIISKSDRLYLWDKNCPVFTTNMAAIGNESGVLINTKGEVIAIIVQDKNNAQSSVLKACSISEIKNQINCLVEEKQGQYIGIKISEITNKISKLHNIPTGIFIREVAPKSPAMQAGLQSGDVITHVNGEKVKTDSSFSRNIEKMKTGDVCEMTLQRQNGAGYYELKCSVKMGNLK